MLKVLELTVFSLKCSMSVASEHGGDKWHLFCII